jgi:hypothetical protein
MTISMFSSSRKLLRTLKRGMPVFWQFPVGSENPSQCFAKVFCEILFVDGISAVYLSFGVISKWIVDIQEYLNQGTWFSNFVFNR